MVMKIEMLRCFVAVADSGNLSDAGARLGRSVSAVSMMLKQLEDHLGKPLFESDRKNKLSPVGVFVLEQARAATAGFDHTVEAIERFAGGQAGLVRLASVPSVAGTVLPLVYQKMIALHPMVQLHLRDMDSAGVLRALVREQVDIGIATASDRLNDFERIALFDDRFGVVCSANHPLAATDGPLGWDQLHDVTFIANELSGSINTPAFQQIYRTAMTRVHNTVSLLAMVRAGVGVTVLPRMAMQTNPEGLVFCEVDDQSAIRRIDLLYRSQNSLSPAAETLKSLITSAAKKLTVESS